MAQRIIALKVFNEFIQGDNIVIGAEDSASGALLQIDFRGSNAWEGLSKYISFRNARGQKTAPRMLTIDQYRDDVADVYYVPVPMAAVEYAGEVTMTLAGYDPPAREQFSFPNSEGPFFIATEIGESGSDTIRFYGEDNPTMGDKNWVGKKTPWVHMNFQAAKLLDISPTGDRVEGHEVWAGTLDREIFNVTTGAVLYSGGIVTRITTEAATFRVLRNDHIAWEQDEIDLTTAEVLQGEIDAMYQKEARDISELRAYVVDTVEAKVDEVNEEISRLETKHDQDVASLRAAINESWVTVEVGTDGCLYEVRNTP